MVDALLRVQKIIIWVTAHTEITEEIGLEQSMPTPQNLILNPPVLSNLKRRNSLLISAMGLLEKTNGRSSNYTQKVSNAQFPQLLSSTTIYIFNFSTGSNKK